MCGRLEKGAWPIQGVPWVGQAHFSKRPHMFANLGDGTYYHSGSLITTRLAGSTILPRLRRRRFSVAQVWS